MTKIICRKLECPSCKCIAMAQIFLRRDGSVRYIRFRHYKGLVKIGNTKQSKPIFEFHPVENLAEFLETLKAQGISLTIEKPKTENGQAGQGQAETIHAPILNDSSPKQQNKVGLWCGRRDLNPGSLAWKANVLNQTRRRPRTLSPYLRLDLSLSGVIRNNIHFFVSSSLFSIA